MTSATLQRTPLDLYRRPGRNPRTLTERLFNLWRTLEIWQARARQRRDLLDLDDRLLRDIGINRADAEREARKPFWVE
ncbi:MAG: DUF1127 domain-containing protein [Proteobacteria bacterium]|nr:MAG: DUF1127 domain-containing protein [Pseudomonadota bacterium]QKK11544.1 MAG: DUF1127 domain-containing protein [Pseudomonadota bacterium]